MQDNCSKGNKTPPNILGNFPAAPCVIHRTDALGNESALQFAGLSIRQTVAMHIFASLMVHPTRSVAPEFEVADAFKYADAFLQFEYDEAMAQADAEPIPTNLIIAPGGN